MAQKVIEDHITLVIEALQQSIAHAGNPTNYEVETHTVVRTVSAADQFMKQTVNFEVDLTTMQTGSQTIEALNEEYKALRP